MMRSYFLFSLCLNLLVSPLANASESHRIQDAEDEISDLQTSQTAERKTVTDDRLAVTKATADEAAARATFDDADASLPADGQRSPEQQAQWKKAQAAAARAQTALTQAKAKFEIDSDDLLQGKSNLKEKEDKLDRLQADADQKAKMPDCPDGSCNGPVKGAPNAKADDKTNFQGIADMIKAVTPLGLGIVSATSSYLCNKQASSDYNYYGQTQSSLGLPIATRAPSSCGAGGLSVASGLGGGGGIAGGGMASIWPSTLGEYASGVGAGTGFSGFGGSGGLGAYGGGSSGFGLGGSGYGGYGLGFGAGSSAGYGSMYGSSGSGYGFGSTVVPYMAGRYLPYSGAYASSYGSSYGNGYGNGYGSSGVGYSLPNSVYGYGSSGMYGGGIGGNSLSQNNSASYRLAQQQSIFSSDASAAQSGLASANSQYGSALSALGMSNTGYGGTYNGLYSGSNGSTNPYYSGYSSYPYASYLNYNYIGGNASVSAVSSASNRQ